MIPSGAFAAVPECDLVAGENYWVEYSHTGGTKVHQVLATFLYLDAQRLLNFKIGPQQDLDLPAETSLEIAVWQKMRSDGRASRINKGLYTRKNPLDVGDLPPTNLLDPHEAGISIDEQADRIRNFQRYQDARSLRFFTMAADDRGTISRGMKGATQFIQCLASEARKAGHTWIPSAGTLLRAIDFCGVPGSRPICAFFRDYMKHEREKRWHPFVIKTADAKIDKFWGDVNQSINGLYAELCDDIRTQKDQLKANGFGIPDNLYAPSRETFRTWLRDTEDWENTAARYGEKIANARFIGHGKHIRATRILEYVLIDHTVVDCWSLIIDENGDVVLIEKPTLTVAIDLYSHMILGAVLSYEKPSLWSVGAVLKQIIRRKDFLEGEYGVRGATDGYGRPLTIIVDNGWEFIGMSFKAMCEAGGINVHWARVRTPQYKAVVERVLGSLNTGVWHKLPGGTPMTPTMRSRLELNPRDAVYYGLEHLERLMWAYIVTILHLEVHRTMGCSPEAAWVAGLEKTGRPMIDSVRVFDSILGEGKRCILTPQGIHVFGEHFHDQRITTELLADLVPGTAKLGASARSLKRSSIEVYVTRDRTDASYISVWNPVTKQGVRLPHFNIDQKISWHILELLRAWVTERNLAFESAEDRMRARAEFNRLLTGEIAAVPFATGRKFASELVPSPSLVPGDAVKEIFVPASHDGAVDIVHDMSLTHRLDNLVPDKGPDRGKRRGKSSSRKGKGNAKASRSRSPKTEQIEPPLATRNVAAALPPPDYSTTTHDELDDPDAFLLALSMEN